jgi:hypothetical protein
MMVALFLTTTISCKSAAGLLQRISKNVLLTEHQKIELIAELHRTIPFCPFIVEKDDN